eukprot:tig00021435_g21393.t1
MPDDGAPVVEGAPSTGHHGRTYTAEQVKLKDEFRAKLADVTDEEKRAWLDDACLYRHLRARSWDLTKAETMLRAGMKWRFDDYRPMDIKWSEVEKEGETGKVYRNGKDKLGHPVLIMRPKNQNTKDRVGQIKLLVYMLERCCEEMTDGVEQLLLIIDFKGYGYSNAPDMGTSQETLHIVSNYYPERLFRALSVDPPWIFWAFYKLITPFIDPITAQKVQFAPEGRDSSAAAYDKLYELVPKEDLEELLHGSSKWVFKVEDYRVDELANDLRKVRLREERQKRAAAAGSSSSGEAAAAAAATAEAQA